MIGIIISMIIAVIIIIISVTIKNNLKNISKNGVEVEGIVFDSELSTLGTASTYPVVRFLTKENNWVTEKSSIATMPGFYKKGEKVQIIYRDQEPNKFYINDGRTTSVPIILIVIGSVIIILALLKLTGLL